MGVIVAYTGKEPALGYLLQGMAPCKEYPYMGVGAGFSDGSVHKLVGKLADFQSQVRSTATLGMAHMRHSLSAGSHRQENLHPHTDATERIFVVQNGSLEYPAMHRGVLRKYGVQLFSETDTEIIPHVIVRLMEQEKVSFIEAVRKTPKHLPGEYAFVAFCIDCPGVLALVSTAMTPLYFGKKKYGYIVGSDRKSLSTQGAHNICLVVKGEMAVLTPGEPPSTYYL